MGIDTIMLLIAGLASASGLWLIGSAIVDKRRGRFVDRPFVVIGVVFVIAAIGLSAFTLTSSLGAA